MCELLPLAGYLRARVHTQKQHAAMRQRSHLATCQQLAFLLHLSMIGLFCAVAVKLQTGLQA